MATLRVHRAAITEAVIPKLRVHRAALSGSAVTLPTLRIHRASLSGTLAPRISPLGDMTLVEPARTMSITASLVEAMSATWAWRVISNPSVTISQSGATVTFTTPSTMPPNGADVALGVTATSGSVASPEETLTISVLPQTRWWYTPTGYVGRKGGTF